MTEAAYQIIKNIVLCSISVYGVIEALKPIIKKITSNWARATIRTCALCCGAALGYYLIATPEGALSGAAGAALSSVIVAQVKKRIKAAGKPDCCKPEKDGR